MKLVEGGLEIEADPTLVDVATLCIATPVGVPSA
jgi:hypothetical protein